MKNALAQWGFLSKSRSALPIVFLVLSACSQEFGIELKKLTDSSLPEFCQLEDGSVITTTNGECINDPVGEILTKKISSFDASSIQNKKIDVVMVIDNSGSMDAEQQKVRDGLAAVASQYLSHANFTQDSLDVCVHVISSSHYLNSPAGEGFVGCTSNSNINLPNLVNDAVNLGINGSGVEALGKSLITYLSGKNSFSDVVSAPSLNKLSQFRNDATLALIMVTDEGNYKAYSSSQLGREETKEAYEPFTNGSGENQTWFDNGDWDYDRNDIPSVTNKLGRASARAADLNNLVQDSRVGIKNYIQQLGFNLQKTTALNFLKSNIVDGVLVPAPLANGPSMGDKNLFDLKAVFGNGSINADIDGNSNSYTSQFQQLFSNSVSIQSQFPLSPAAATSVGMVVIRVRNGQETVLSSSSYSLVQNGNALQLTSQAAAQIQSGDSIKVTYFHR